MDKLVRPEVVLLDWDNTLISSESMMHMILDDVMDEMGINKSEVYDSVTFVQAIHLSARNAFPRIFGDRWEEVYRQYQERFRKMHLEYISLLPGVIDLLEHLSAKGITLSIVSNKDGHFLRQEVEELGVAKYFYAVVGSGDASEDKPSIQPALLALDGLYDRAALQLVESWFIGDTIADLECGHNSHCTSILYGNNQYAMDEAARKGIKYHRISDYQKFLESINAI